mmetsp:Transcript_13478/g.32180  ORF Transcript_13478/g.32180 Transcript_13478/m.32180 type:complete len:203 (-) Transcript_13478:38-646(-)
MALPEAEVLEERHQSGAVALHLRAVLPLLHSCLWCDVQLWLPGFPRQVRPGIHMQHLHSGPSAGAQVPLVQLPGYFLPLRGLRHSRLQECPTSRPHSGWLRCDDDHGRDTLLRLQANRQASEAEELWPQGGCGYEVLHRPDLLRAVLLSLWRDFLPRELGVSLLPGHRARAFFERRERNDRSLRRKPSASPPRCACGHQGSQ